MFAAHDSERKRPRSRLEILTIVVRSLLDRDHDQARSWHLLEQKLSEIHGESWSYDVAPRNLVAYDPRRHQDTIPRRLRSPFARASIRLSLFLYYELLTRTCLSGSSLISLFLLGFRVGSSLFGIPFVKPLLL